MDVVFESTITKNIRNFKDPFRSERFGRNSERRIRKAWKNVLGQDEFLELQTVDGWSSKSDYHNDPEKL